ncbi:hypothetical protein ABT010_13345 [Streptomyces sp. NPDC002668]|uniref:hypothetical protein n=1 Tax=Streptomyces sp. NPDC002668 TaxID=3154422 RepID=UPI00332466AA
MPLHLITTLWPSDEDLHEASGAMRRALLDEYLAALRIPGETRRVVLEIGAYDEAHPDEPPLMDELAGFWIPAAA